MTDQQHANRIEKARKVLNEAIKAAQTAGLVVDGEDDGPFVAAYDVRRHLQGRPE